MPVKIIGLGPSGKDGLTLKAYKALKESKPESIYLRTGIHPAAEELKEEGLVFKTFDDLYEQSQSFEEIYEKIAQVLTDKGKTEEIIYAVPGNPFFNEKSVEILIKKLKEQGIDYEVITGMGFLDVIAPAVEEDLGEGLAVIDAFDLVDNRVRPNTQKPALITQAFDQHMLSEIKLNLMRTYPDDTKIFLVSNAGLEDEKLIEVKLYELDRQEANHLTSVFIPAYPNQLNRFEAIEGITRKLRMPGGCPWDRKQTHESLKRYLVEESAEVLDAIDNTDYDNLKEELGDLLFQVLIHAQISDEEGYFDVYDVIENLSEKMIRRHPHVFGDKDFKTSAEVLKSWDKIKEEEKQITSLSEDMRRIPKTLTALLISDKIQDKARTVGFDWNDPREALEKVREEAEEVREVLDCEDSEAVHLKEEIGDLLFAAVNVARLSKVDPEDALKQANNKFIDRFEKMEKAAELEGADLSDLTLEEQEKLWIKAKS